MSLLNPACIGVLLSLAGCVFLPYPAEVEVSKETVAVDATQLDLFHLKLWNPADEATRRIESPAYSDFGFGADLVECVSDALPRNKVEVMPSEQFWRLVAEEGEVAIPGPELLINDRIREKIGRSKVRYVVTVQGRTWIKKGKGYHGLYAGAGSGKEHALAEAIVLDIDARQAVALVIVEAKGTTAGVTSIVTVGVIPMTLSSACNGLGVAIAKMISPAGDDPSVTAAILPAYFYSINLPPTECHLPFADAVQQDSTILIERVQHCGGAKHSRTSLMWVCLAAHGGHGPAEATLGDLYRSGDYPIKQNLLRAYIWYSLAEAHGIRDETYVRTATGWACCFDKPRREIVAEKLTPAQIAEAERLVAEWEPNPAECEIYSDETHAP